MIMKKFTKSEIIISACFGLLVIFGFGCCVMIHNYQIRYKRVIERIVEINAENVELRQQLNEEKMKNNPALERHIVKLNESYKSFIAE